MCACIHVYVCVCTMCACLFAYLLAYLHIWTGLQSSCHHRNLQVIDDARLQICIICFPCRRSHNWWCLWYGPVYPLTWCAVSPVSWCWCVAAPWQALLASSWVAACLHCLSENGVKCFRIQNLHGLTIFERYIGSVVIVVVVLLALIVLPLPLLLLLLLYLSLWSCRSAWLPLPVCLYTRPVNIWRLLQGTRQTHTHTHTHHNGSQARPRSCPLGHRQRLQLAKCLRTPNCSVCRPKYTPHPPQRGTFVMFVQVNERSEKVENSIQRELNSSSIVNENEPADSGSVIHLYYIFTSGNCIGDRRAAAGCYAS